MFGTRSASNELDYRSREAGIAVLHLVLNSRLSPNDQIEIVQAMYDKLSRTCDKYLEPLKHNDPLKFYGFIHNLEKLHRVYIKLLQIKYLNSEQLEPPYVRRRIEQTAGKAVEPIFWLADACKILSEK